MRAGRKIRCTDEVGDRSAVQGREHHPDHDVVGVGVAEGGAGLEYPRLRQGIVDELMVGPWHADQVDGLLRAGRPGDDGCQVLGQSAAVAEKLLHGDLVVAG